MGHSVWYKHIFRNNKFYKKTIYASENGKTGFKNCQNFSMSKNPGDRKIQKFEIFLFPLVKEWVVIYVIFSVDYDAARIFSLSRSEDS